MAATGGSGGSKARGTFGKMGFILAAAGSAVGLGNLWKFPYMAHRNGGGAFVLVYLVAVLLLGLPIMMAEITVGRSTASNPVRAFRRLGGKWWSLVGWLGIGTGFIILSYYSVVAGWTIEYVGKCLAWSAQGFTKADAAKVGSDFMAFLARGDKQVLYHGIFMALTAGVIIFGVKKGIEAVTKVLMPALFLILLLLVAVAATTSSFLPALERLFLPGKIGARGILEAVGQAFFSLSLGMGAMLTYGSYMSRKESIPRSAAMVCGLDTLVALMASVIMFTIIMGVPPDQRGKFGASSVILFTTLPEMLYNLPLGRILAPSFYLLVGFAALTSTISLLEVLVSWFIDDLGWKRSFATVTVGLATFAMGVPSALSFGSNEFLTSRFAPLAPKASGFFDTFDYLAANFLLPIGGLLTAIFVGWYLSSAFTKKEVEEGHGPFRLHLLWKTLLRFVCPGAIAWILYSVVFQGVKFN